MNHVRWVALALFAGALGGASPAFGQSSGGSIDIQQFRPAIDSKGYITVNASQILGHLEPSFGLVTSWGRKPLVFKNGDARYDVLNLITPQLQAALGLFRYAELGLGVPFTVNSGEEGGGGETKTLGEQGVGDLQISLKGRFLPASKHFVGLAAIVSVFAPTGPKDNWIGERQTIIQPSLIVDKDFGRSRRLRAAINVGARIRPSNRSWSDTDTGDTGTRTPTGETLAVGSELLYGAGLSYAIVPHRFDLVGEIFGAFGGKAGNAGQSAARTAPVEGDAGVKLYLARNSFLLLGAGGGINPKGYGTPIVRVFGAFIFEPRVGDRDGDGIPDDVDKCPDDPEDFDDFEDEDGCPDPDNDKDGIPDKDDKCPNEPETYNGFEDEDGCPDKGRVIVRKGKIEILDKIYFETDKDVIKEVSFPLLDAIAATIKGHPEIALIEIQGHADERGDDEHNLDLTDRRAHSVMRALEDRGVELGRLKARGYGETKPVCRQHNEDCWSKNRRVEFIILKRVDEAVLQGDAGQ